MFDLEDLVTRYAVPDRSVPHLRVNFIASVDGAASHGGVSGPLNNEVDKEVFETLRMLSDVVIVGAGTVRDEGYGAMRLPEHLVEWRVANGLPEHPVFAILTSRATLPLDGEMFTDAPVRAVCITHERSADPAQDPERNRRLAALGEVADVLLCGDDRLDPQAMVSALAARGLPQMLSEGGPHVFGALIEADAVDELDLTIAPVLEGGDATRVSAGGAQTTRQMRLELAMPAGGMLFLRYLRDR